MKRIRITLIQLIKLCRRMASRNGNYAAFYVAEPFSESNLGANTAKDFVYYNMLRAWKGADSSFPFNDSHDKTYNVRDDSDWEKTLKPRLHKRLNNSKNVILFLSSETKNSRALREEIDYAINHEGLPIIAVYPEFHSKEDIIDSNEIRQQIKNLWDYLPIFRDSKCKVPVIHVPMNKDIIRQCLDYELFSVQTKGDKRGDYWWKL